MFSFSRPLLFGLAVTVALSRSAMRTDAFAAFRSCRSSSLSPRAPPPLAPLLVPALRANAVALRNSARVEAENFLADAYPTFRMLLDKNPEVVGAVLRDADAELGFTAFAPTESAFSNLGIDRLNALDDPRNDAAARMLAAYHVVPAPISSPVLFNGRGTTLLTTLGGKVPVTSADADGDGIQLNGGRILRTFQFRDGEVRNYVDRSGNALGSEATETTGGTRGICTVHEVDGLVCPDEIWGNFYASDDPQQQQQQQGY